MDKKYREQIEINEKILKEYSRKSNMIGNVKLLVCLIFGAIILRNVINGESIWVFLLIVSITLIPLWIHHSKIIAKVEKSKILIKINQQYLSRIDGTWINFADTAKEFADPNHPYACDLDIVGNKSLFQLLNVSNTYFGRKKFVADLLESNYNKSEILKRQEAIRELSEDIIFSNEFQHISSQIKPNDEFESLLDNLKKDIKFINNPLLRFILKYLPLFTAPFIAATVIFQIESLYFPNRKPVFYCCSHSNGASFYVGVWCTQKYDIFFFSCRDSIQFQSLQRFTKINSNKRF